MRICIYSRHAWSLVRSDSPRHGGAEHNLLRIARELAKTDAVTLVTVSDEPAQPEVIDRVRFLPVHYGVPAPGSGPEPARKLRLARFAARLAAALWRTRADLSFTSLASKDSLLVARVAKLRRKPLVYRVAHDWETQLEPLRDRIFGGDAELAGSFHGMLARAAVVVAQTARQQELLQANLGMGSVVIPNAHYMPGELPAAGSRTHVLWVGRAGVMKRPLLFLEVAQRIAPVPCVMICPPDENRPDLYESLRTGAAGVANLRLIPGVPAEQLADYYLKARAVAITSEAEGLPNVMIEAFKSGAPVVSLSVNTGGVLHGRDRLPPEPRDLSLAAIGGDARFVGVCADGDIAYMAEALHALVTDDALWAAASENGARFARETYDIALIVPRLREEFRKATS
jgi:glycosyltransferase involved in cell wall biosynthesis